MQALIKYLTLHEIPKFHLIDLLRGFYRSGQFSQRLMLLARNLVETACVHRISLPGTLVKLTCSEQYLSIYLLFLMIFGYGIFYGITNFSKYHFVDVY